MDYREIIEKLDKLKERIDKETDENQLLILQKELVDTMTLLLESFLPK